MNFIKQTYMFFVCILVMWALGAGIVSIAQKTALHEGWWRTLLGVLSFATICSGIQSAWALISKKPMKPLTTPAFDALTTLLLTWLTMYGAFYVIHSYGWKGWWL